MEVIMSWKKLAWLGLSLCVLTWLTLLPAAAQSGDIRLTGHKDWGYSLGNQIQGRFTFSVQGPANLVSAAFLIDGREVATADQPPFQFSIDTGNYPAGPHTLSATVRTADGRTLQSNEQPAEFVGSAQAWESTQRILIPLLLGVLLLVGLGAGGQVWLTSRAQRQGRPLAYGAAGGAICPTCNRPFPLSMFGMNLITGKLARCPHCGKWSVVRRATPAALAVAQAADAEGSRPTVRELSAEEKLRQQIEESRYI
jgi:hypothetical protein